MQKLKLNAKKRELLGKKTKQLRRDGFVPVVMYGKSKKSESLQINAKEFKKVYDIAGSSALIDIAIDDKKPVKVLVQDIQFDPLTDEVIHADLYAIKMDEKLQTEVPLNFVGVAPAQKDLEGNFIANFHEIEIECLPGDLIHEIKVDISGLKTFDDMIRAKDLQVPETVKIMQDPERVIALVTPPRSEEELDELESEAADKEKEVVEKMEAEAQAEQEAKDSEKDNKDSNNDKKTE